MARPVGLLHCPAARTATPTMRVIQLKHPLRFSKQSPPSNYRLFVSHRLLRHPRERTCLLSILRKSTLSPICVKPINLFINSKWKCNKHKSLSYRVYFRRICHHAEYRSPSLALRQESITSTSPRMGRSKSLLSLDEHLEHPAVDSLTLRHNMGGGVQKWC